MIMIFAHLCGMLLPTILMVKKYLIQLGRSNIHHCLTMVHSYIASIERRFSNELDCYTPREERAPIATLSLPQLKNQWFSCISSTEQEHVLQIFDELISKQLTPAAPQEIEPMEVDNFYDFSGGFSLASTSTVAPEDFVNNLISEKISCISNIRARRATLADVWK